MEFHLADGTKLNKTYPVPFLIPNRAMKKSVKEGDLVLLYIKFGTRRHPKPKGGQVGEKCWVRVVISAYPHFYGEIGSFSRAVPELNGLMQFKGEHILEIHKESE